MINWNKNKNPYDFSAESKVNQYWNQSMNMQPQTKFESFKSKKKLPFVIQNESPANKDSRLKSMYDKENPQKKTIIPPQNQSSQSLYDPYKITWKIYWWDETAFSQSKQSKPSYSWRKDESTWKIYWWPENNNQQKNTDNTNIAQNMNQQFHDDFSYIQWVVDIPEDHPKKLELEKRKKNISVYANLTPDDISELISSWQMFPWSDDLNDLSKINPDLVIEAQKRVQEKNNLDTINTNTSWLFKSLNNWNKFSLAKNNNKEEPKKEDLYKKTTQPVNNYVAKELESRYWSYADKYEDTAKELLSAPNVQRRKNDVYKYSDEINKIDQQIENLYEEAWRELWDEAPQYLRSAYISEKSKKLLRLKNPLVKQLNLAQNMLQTETKEQLKKLDMITKWIQTDLSNQHRQQNFDLNKQKFDFQQEQYQDKQYQNSINQIQKAWSANLTPQNVDTRNERMNVIWNLSWSVWWWNAWLWYAISQIPDWTNWWSCWAFVNDALSWVGAKWHFNDFLYQKMQLKNSDTPAVWNVVIMTAKWKNKKYWHVAMITGVDENWNITIKESNRDWPNKVWTRTIKATDPIIAWYYDPKLWQTQPTQTQQKNTANKNISNQNQNNTSFDNDIFKNIISKTWWVKLNPKTKSYTWFFKPKTLEKIWMIWKDPQEVLKYYWSNVVKQSWDDPEKIAKNLITMSQNKWFYDLKDNSWKKISNPLQNSPAYFKEAWLDTETAVKSYMNILKKSLKEWAEYDIDDKEKSFDASMWTLLMYYPELRGNKEKTLKLMREVISDDDFDDMFDENWIDWFTNWIEQYYDQWMDFYNK